MIRYGTHHFVTADAARRYYKGQGDADCFGPGWIKRIDEKIQAGEIAIGKPPLPPGAKLIIIDNGTRYAIEEPKVKIGGPAFPYNELSQQTGGVYAQHAGMSLRDWFAGQALAGIVGTNYDWFTSDSADYGSRVHSAAHFAYSLADAMIAARAQGGAA